MADFASRLRELRKDRSLRQADLASALGLAQTTIANYEQHSRFPDEKTLREIANFFDVSLDYLMGRTDIEALPQKILEYRGNTGPESSALDPVARTYLEKLMYGDKADAFQFIVSLVHNGLTVQKIYREIFEPALKEAGRMWETNEIDVSQEHYFSRATESLMGQLYAHLDISPEKKGTVVLVAIGGELHEIGIRMVSDFLEADGWRCFYLGVNTPTANVVKALRDRDADVLAISATLSLNVDAVANMIRHVRSATTENGWKRIKIVAGGQAFNLNPDMWKRVDADGYAANADEAVELVSRLVNSTEPANRKANK